MIIDKSKINASVKGTDYENFLLDLNKKTSLNKDIEILFEKIYTDFNLRFQTMDKNIFLYQTSDEIITGFSSPLFFEQIINYYENNELPKSLVDFFINSNYYKITQTTKYMYEALSDIVTSFTKGKYFNNNYHNSMDIKNWNNNQFLIYGHNNSYYSKDNEPNIPVIIFELFANYISICLLPNKDAYDLLKEIKNLQIDCIRSKNRSIFPNRHRLLSVKNFRLQLSPGTKIYSLTTFFITSGTNTCM